MSVEKGTPLIMMITVQTKDRKVMTFCAECFVNHFNKYNVMSLLSTMAGSAVFLKKSTVRNRLMY